MLSTHILTILKEKLNTSIDDLISRIHGLEEFELEMIKTKNDSLKNDYEQEQQFYESSKNEVIQNTKVLLDFLEKSQSTQQQPSSVKLTIKWK